MIVPDHKVAVVAWLNVVVYGSENIPVNVGSNEGCVPADTLTLKSVEF